MVSYYWGGAMVGRLIGSGAAVPRQGARALVARGLRARRRRLLCLAVTQLHGSTAAYLALSIGLFNSIMFPVIFTSTLERSTAAPAATSGLLCLAIVGGAILPYVYGLIADASGLHTAYFLPAVAYALIVVFAIAATRAKTYEHGTCNRSRGSLRGDVMDDKARIDATTQPAVQLAAAMPPIHCGRRRASTRRAATSNGSARTASRFAEPRRSRVTPRQAFCFAMGPSLGWKGDAATLVKHGLDFWFAKFQRPDGLFRTLINADGSVADDRAITYDHAFGLLAFHLGATLGDWRAERERQAHELLQTVLKHTRRADGGFENGVPQQLAARIQPAHAPLRSHARGLRGGAPRPICGSRWLTKSRSSRWRVSSTATACSTNSSMRTGSSRKA